MIQCCFGCSPYFVLTGTHPLIPFDIMEANYLLPPPDLILSTKDLITHRVITLQKHCKHLTKIHNQVYDACRKAAIKFEENHDNTICDFNFKLGDLVLICNTVIEKLLNRKMRLWYLGPLSLLHSEQECSLAKGM